MAASKPECKAPGNADVDDDGKARRFRDAALPHLDDVYTLARYMLRNAADAEDAVQECYLRALRHFDTYRGPAMKPWLFAILRNVCRSEFVRRSGVALTIDGRAEEDDDAVPLWQEAPLSPEADMLRQWDAETIRRLVAELPDLFREAIVLREINDLVIQPDRRCRRCPHRYRDVASGTCTLAAPQGMDGRGRSAHMTCAEAEILLHALLDDELDAGHAFEVEAHLATCPRCAAQLRAYRELQQAMPAAQLGFAAPMSLRRRVEAALPSPPARVSSRRSVLKGFAIGSALSAAMAATLVVAVIRTDRDQRALGDALSAHLRSLQGEHLTDVQTSDQHTVKPWFNGRLDVAPPVVDLTAQGFRLIGGRLDYIDGRAVAAIVYRRRTHVINLFIAPAAASEGGGAKIEKVQGFNIRRWNADGLEFWAVSDIDAEELQEFGAKFEAGLHEAGRT